jgi:hypothetical protein
VNGSGWVYDENLAEFINEIDNVSTIKRKDALERLAKSIETTMNNQLAEPIAFLMNELSTEKLWENILEVLELVINSSETTLKCKLSGLGITNELVKISVLKMKMQAWNRFLQVIKIEVSDISIHEKLRRKFENLFRYDLKGIPRVWKPTDDIESYYHSAKQESEKLLGFLSKIDIKVSSIDSDIVQNQVLFN